MAEGEKGTNVKEELCSTQIGITRTFRDLRPSHCLLKIDSYSLLGEERYESDIFEAGGYKWKLIFYPDGDTKRNGKGFISLYISIVETNDLPQGWEANVIFKLFLLDQTREKYLTIQDGEGTISRFSDVKMERGFPQLLSLDMFKNASNGYLIDDSCVLGAEVFILKYACKLQCISFAKQLMEGEKSSQRVANVKEELSSTQMGITGTFRDLRPSHCLLKIDSYSLFDEERYESDVFEAGDGDTKRNGKGFISLYISMVGTNDLPQGWEVNVIFKLFVLDQLREKYLTVQDGEGTIGRFSEVKMQRGFPQLLSLQMFKNASNGFLIDDSCVLGAEVFVLKCACKLQSLTYAKQLIGNTYTWKIDNFSTLDKKYYYSEAFIISGIRWKLLFHPKEEGDAPSLYLKGVDVQDKQEVLTDCKLRIQDQVSGGHHEKTLSHLFTSTKDGLGFISFITAKELHDTSKGFILKDSVIVGVEFTEIKINWV